MEFIEAALNPRFLPKCCFERSLRGPPKNEGQANKKTEKNRGIVRPAARDGRAQAHGRAPLCATRRACTHARALSYFPLLHYSWCSRLPRTSSLP